jgi:hypothetical protein
MTNNPIELGRRAEAARDSYLIGLFDRLREQLFKDFMTCTDPSELPRLFDRKEAITYIQNQVKTDIQRGIDAQRDLNK